MTIKKILNNTFQYPTSNKSRKIISAFLGSFIFSFLSIFQPFNLHNVEIDRKFFIALGYGMIAFVVIFFNHKITSRYFKNHRISIKGLIGWYFFNSFTTAVISSSYNDIIFNGVLFTLDSFLKFQYYIFVLFLIPSAIIIITIRSNRMKNIYIAQNKDNVNFLSEKIVIHTENPSNNLKIEASNLIYITSANNYVDIYYLTENKVKHTLLRNTLKNVEEDLQEFSNFCRCHKGYIVNLRKVNKISSGVNGVKLHLNIAETIIPVSRSLSKMVRERIKEFIQ